MTLDSLGFSVKDFKFPNNRLSLILHLLVNNRPLNKPRGPFQSSNKDILIDKFCAP